MSRVSFTRKSSVIVLSIILSLFLILLLAFAIGTAAGSAKVIAEPTASPPGVRLLWTGAMRPVATPKPVAVPHRSALKAPTRFPRNDPPDVVLASARIDGDVLATGDASWYGDPPCGSRGAAMLSYTWGRPYFQVVVTHAGRSITATVCDNGPHVSGRVIDLSTALFAELCPSCDGIISGVTVRRA